MRKDSFSVIIVPHDLGKPRNFRISYRLFYTFVAIAAIGAVAIIVFVFTYGKLLVKARESVMLERRVAELTTRNEQIGEITRNLSKLRAMDRQIREMLGVEIGPEDSLASTEVMRVDRMTDTELEAQEAQVLRSIPSFWPVRGYMTRGFNIGAGRQDPSYHPGIDIGVERGTPVRASASGIIIEAGWDDTYGYYLKIDHGYGIKTLYGHNDRLVVIKGERVGRGQTIAYSGSTGKSSAPHLHFEVIQNNTPVDPLMYLLQ